MSRPPGSEVIVVGLCTYRRPKLLVRALEHVARSIARAACEARIVVVDNDGKDAAVGEAVRDFARRSGIATDYHAEHKPGIAAARETVFRLANGLGATVLAMVDDDEWPEATWLASMLAEWRRTRATVVGGPVRPVFPESAAALRRHARFWSVERQIVGGMPYIYAAGNFLIDLVAIADVPRPLFDDAFGLSGGEDVVFFQGLRAAGHTMAWAEEAVVWEEVPVDRASLAWIHQRRLGVGNNAVRWEQVRSRWRPLFKTLVLTARLPIYPLLRREPETPWLGWSLEWAKLRGRYAAHLGDVRLQYAHGDTPRP